MGAAEPGRRTCWPARKRRARADLWADAVPEASTWITFDTLARCWESPPYKTAQFAVTGSGNDIRNWPDEDVRSFLYQYHVVLPCGWIRILIGSLPSRRHPGACS